MESAGVINKIDCEWFPFRKPWYRPSRQAQVLPVTPTMAGVCASAHVSRTAKYIINYTGAFTFSDMSKLNISHRTRLIRDMCWMSFPISPSP